jgi:hypothetical protein
MELDKSVTQGMAKYRIVAYNIDKSEGAEPVLYRH